MSSRLQTVAASVELDDIQGLVRFAYKHHTQAVFLLFRVRDAAAARSWLAQAAIADATTRDSLAPTALQIAFTSEGLRALGVADAIVDGFSLEFLAGMASDAARSRRLGDMGESDPGRWRWGSGARVPHVALLLYALPDHLEQWQRSIEAQCEAGFEPLARLETSDLQGVEPFGFVDGISQPQLDWERRKAAQARQQLSYSNLSCLGEFLLGYPNEYGLYTPRPVLDARLDPTAMLPRAEDATDQADLGRNGSYLVMRQLRQDVSGFWRCLDAHAGGDPAQRKHLAQAMVGRTMQGEPLVTLGARAGATDSGGAGADLNGFTYRSDPAGMRCPLGAHIRRANPRTADLPFGSSGIVSRLLRALGFDAAARRQDLLASTRFHRLLRRGREYGAAVPVERALSVPAGGETGLQFMCLAANIMRQFEFVQSAWLMGTRFNALAGQSDPLLGDRTPDAAGAATSGYTMPQREGPDRILSGLPRFITVVGGAYFFLPGIRALRYLATAR